MRDSSPSWREVTAVLVMAAVTSLAVAVSARTVIALLGPVVPVLRRGRVAVVRHPIPGPNILLLQPL
jgi:hypothetical protein